METLSRQDKIRALTKRGMLLAEKGATATDGTNAEHVQALLDQIKVECSKRIEKLKRDLAAAKSKQQQVFASGMLKLPKSVRNMTLAEFKLVYKYDLMTLLNEKENNASTLKQNDGLAASTPAPTKVGARAVFTPSRTARRGEELYSKNGSPLETMEDGALVVTVQKPKKGTSLTDTVAANLDLNIGGECISLSDPNALVQLDDEVKNVAKTQVMLLQEQLATIMEQLTK